MIEFRNVSKVYNNGTEALHNINLKVDKGEFVFIVGSSGAGKSTFLKLIMCEEHPNSGQIILDGVDIARLRKGKVPYVRRKMGIVFQDFRLIEHMTVYDNVAFAMRVIGASGKSIKKRVPYILSLVGLQHKAKHIPSELSGGERQRVGLARALVNNPSMIIADEPTGNIDPALSFEIVDLLSEINRRGTTILMVTHEHSLVKHFHKRIIQIHSGEIVADTAEIAAHNDEEIEAGIDDYQGEEPVSVEPQSVQSVDVGDGELYRTSSIPEISPDEAQSGSGYEEYQSYDGEEGYDDYPGNAENPGGYDQESGGYFQGPDDSQMSFETVGQTEEAYSGGEELSEPVEAPNPSGQVAQGSVKRKQRKHRPPMKPNEMADEVTTRKEGGEKRGSARGSSERSGK